MNSKIILVIGLALLFMTSCTSEEEKTTQEFIGHAQNLHIDELKNMSTEDTRFYIKMFMESLVSLGDEKSISQLKEVASTLECSGEDKNRKCTFFDENGKKQSFEIVLVEGYDDESEERLYVDIDKKYFLGD